MKHIVDSDWIVDGIAGFPGARTTLDALERDGLAISIVTLGELYDGAFIFPDPSAQLQTYREFVSGYIVLNLSDPIMEVFGRIRSDLRRQGQLIPDLDLLIGATALTHDLTLVTRNRRHFERIPGLALYRPS